MIQAFHSFKYKKKHVKFACKNVYKKVGPASNVLHACTCTATNSAIRLSFSLQPKALRILYSMD